MYLTKREIKQLKSDLMSRQSNKTSDSSNIKVNNSSDKISEIVTKEVRISMNDVIGVNFEENIRKTLEIEYKWKIPYIPRHFFYRDISFKNQTYSLCPFDFLDSENLSISIDPKTNDCYFKHKGNNKKDIKITEKNCVTNITFQKIKFAISPPKEVELDGIYQNFDYDAVPFDKNEIVELFDNTHYKKYDYAIIEIKLNAQKLDELIEQLKNAQIVMSKIIKKSVVYLGFVNIKKTDYEIIEKFNFAEICGEFQCILYGIKNGSFCGRNITFYIDWKSVKELKELKAITQGIEKKIENIQHDVNFLKRKRKCKPLKYTH